MMTSATLHFRHSTFASERRNFAVAMITAIILADRISPQIQDTPPCLLPLENESILSRIARVVLRGPFGGTLIASRADIQADIEEELQGYAVQHVKLPNDAAPGSIAALAPALKHAEDFRKRWEKARAAAASRFGDDDDEDDKESHDAKPAKKKSGAGGAAAAWPLHRKNADVKVRGLARSFERDGVLLFHADAPLIRPELQAQLIEAFAREAEKSAQPRPFAQCIAAGVRGWPLAIDARAVSELLALSPATLLDDWLLTQLARVQDVSVPDGTSLERVLVEADYLRIEGPERKG